MTPGVLAQFDIRSLRRILICMAFRLILLCIAVAVCALWPQGLVLCVGDSGHIDFEPGSAPCCPDEERGGDDDCADCRDYDSPELTGAGSSHHLPPPALFATSGDAPTPDALAAPLAEDVTPPRHDEAGHLTVVLLV